MMKRSASAGDRGEEENERPERRGKGNRERKEERWTGEKEVAKITGMFTNGKESRIGPVEEARSRILYYSRERGSGVERKQEENIEENK